MDGAGDCAGMRAAVGAGMAMLAVATGIAEGRQSVATHCATGQSALLQHRRAGAAASRELCSTNTSAMTRAKIVRIGLL